MTSSYPSVPTYPGSRLLGSLTRFRRDPLDLLMSGFHKLGDVVHFRMFTRHLVLVSHPNHVRQVLQEHAGNYSKRTRGFEVLRAFLRKGLLTRDSGRTTSALTRTALRRLARPRSHRSRISPSAAVPASASGTTSP